MNRHSLITGLVWGCMVFLSVGLIAQDTTFDTQLFGGCGADSLSPETTKDHPLFSISYPAHWEVENDLKQGLDIQSNAFADSLQRGFLLSVVPNKPMYLKPNPTIDYYEFETGRYQGYEAVYLTRNDLGVQEDGSIYWRSELKLVSEDNEFIYILVFGQRHTGSAPPPWRDFQSIVESLEIKR